GAEHRAVALELGTNQPGEIAALADMSRPTVGVVTVVSTAHTEFLGSLEGVQAEKGALVRAIPSDGWVVLNSDDPRVLAMRALSRGRGGTVGTRGSVDVRSSGPVTETDAGLSLSLEVNGARRDVTLHCFGRHNVINALAAAGVGLAVGLGLEQIARGLEAAPPIKGRCAWRGAGQLRILDDTYNANPSSVLAALETFAVGARARRRIVVLGDMLELGDITAQAHRDAGRAVAASGAAEFIGVGQHARE